VLSGAAEKLVRSTLSYADAERYLAREFAKADANNDTSLDLNEFTKLIRSLSLNISEEEMECLRAAIDSDSDGRIVLSEVLAKSPYLLKKM
jgi:Ca2+-binding EF-hand superfamily protein